MVENVFVKLDSLEGSGLDCIPVVVLRKSEPELSDILAELFNMFCFPDFWKVVSVIPVLKNIGERSTAKNYCPVFEKLVNNRIFDHPEKRGFFSDFQCGFMSGIWSDFSGISAQMCGVIPSFLSNGRLWVVLDGKSSQEYQVNAEFLNDPLVPHFS